MLLVTWSLLLIAMFLKKSKKAPPQYYVWILLGIVVFGLVLWGWQSWWKKLPDNPRQAVTEVMEKMDKVKSIDLNIEHKLTAPGSEDIVISAQIELKMPAEYQGKMKVTGPEIFLKELPFAPERQFVNLQDKHYTRDLGQEEWTDHSGDSDFVPFLKIEPLSFLRFSLEKAEIARENDEEIQGKNYAVYSFAYSQEAVAEALKPFALLIDEIPPEAEVQGKIWFDPQTRRLYKQQATVFVPEMGGEEVTTVFSDYDGLVIFDILDNVVSVTPTGTDPAQEEANQDREERNQKRQIDLLAIKVALEKIYDDDRVYPESPQAVNLSEAGTEAHDKLLKYLKEVPADPQTPKYYYAYKCTGGEQYELTGIQESDTGDPKVVVLTQGFNYFEEKK